MTLSGALFVWGKSKGGQLGLGVEETQPVFIPKRVDLGRAVKSIAAGGDHSILILRGGLVLAAGSNTSGQCAHDPGVCACLRMSARVCVSVDVCENLFQTEFFLLLRSEPQPVEFFCCSESSNELSLVHGCCWSQPHNFGLCEGATIH